jgi:hypothetical protein
MRERLDRFYERRIASDSAFRDGEKFRYGALNAGGAGLVAFAPYCVVLTRAFQESLREAACLPGDSLQICFAVDGSFDQTAAERSPSPHTHRHLMAARERADEIPLVDQREWPALVARPGRYFEVIFVGEVSLDVVDCVRVLKTEYERMWDLAFANFRRKLSDAERALVQDFVQLRRAVVDGRTQVEVLG